MDSRAFRNDPFNIRSYAGIRDSSCVYVLCVSRNHRNLQDRMDAAQQLVSSGPACEVVVDTMSDKANYVYGGLYERLYIVLNSRIVYVGARGPQGYRLEEVEEWLDQYKRSKQNSA